MYCRQCGSELPEGSGFCPNCGRAYKAKPSENSPVNAASLPTEKPAKAVGKKKALIAAAAAAVLAIIALVVVLIVQNQPTISPNNFRPNTIPPSTSFSAETLNPSDLVKIKLNLSVEQNNFFAKYGVDVVINGVTVKTINQGETFT